MSEISMPPEEAMPPRRRPRFLRPSLRALMVLIAVGAILLGPLINGVWRQRRAVKELEGMGARVYYDFQVKRFGDPGFWERHPPPQRLVSWLGADCFYKVIVVEAVVRVPDEPGGGPAGPIDKGRGRDCLASLPDVRSLAISQEFRDDRTLEGVEGMKDLEELWIPKAGGVTAEGIARLWGLPKLRSLHVSSEGLGEGACRGIAEIPGLEMLVVDTNTDDGNDFGDREAVQLARSRSIKELYLFATRVSDRSFEAIAAMPQLEVFYTFGFRASDEGLRALEACRDLKSLTLDWVGEQVTEAGIAGLEANPNLELLSINWMNASDEAMDRRNAAADALKVVLPGLSRVNLSRANGGLAPQ